MKTKYMLLIVFVIGFFFNFYYLLKRMNLESNNSFVEIACLYPEYLSRAAYNGTQIVELLKKVVEESPVTTLIFLPETLNSLKEKNEAMVFKGDEVMKVITMEGLFNNLMFELSNKVPVKPMYHYIFVRNQDLFAKVREAMLRYFPPAGVTDMSEVLKNAGSGRRYGYLLEVKTGNLDFVEFPLFFSRADFQMAKKLGFVTAASFADHSVFDRNFFLMRELLTFGDDLDQIVLIPETVVIMNDDQAETLVQLRDGPWRIVVEEFDFPKLPRQFLALFSGKLMRSHEAATVTETDDDHALLLRYLRAARERNVRQLVFHFPPGQMDLSRDILLLNSVRSMLRKSLQPLQVRKNECLPELENPPEFLKVFIISLLVVTAFLVMIDPLIRLPLQGQLVIIFFSSLLLGTGVFFVERFYFEKVLSQFIAFFFPVIGYFYFQNIYWCENEIPAKERFKKGLGYLLLFTGITVFGALLIAGLFNHREFLLKIEQFRSVKLALSVPLLLLVVFLVLQYSSMEKVQSFVKNPVTPLQLAIALSVAALLCLLLVRSGNISPKYISGFEESIRFSLEKNLFIRPRFKEFILGYPLFLTAFCFRGFWRHFFLLLSVLGQISILNTFVHLHTPLSVSLLRTFIGLAVGILIGGAAFWAVSFGQRIWGTVSQEE
ncbi:MAG: DUF5693 family protein [Candidatus Wallbacteria bacterium]|nr:DUF5693 family protein [Candidatus Wallbacteria bacterium]